MTDLPGLLTIRQDTSHKGVVSLLRGHTGHVNVVQFFPTTRDQPNIILSGSTDSTIRIWRSLSWSSTSFEAAESLTSHKGSINCLAVCKGSNLITSGSADTTIKIWQLILDVNEVRVNLLQTIAASPRLFPLALAIHALDESGAHVLAIAGTRSIVQIYASSSDAHFSSQAALTGHADWVRSLAITKESTSKTSDLLLASASQDKYIRLWRIAIRKTAHATKEENMVIELEQRLSNKVHNLNTADKLYNVTFEALLLGHDDWIYTLAWQLNAKGIKLVSASADSSIVTWQPEESSGLWVCTTRLGEISALKGSTTATGGTGGFWIGLISPTGNSLVSLGKTGSWRLWNYEEAQDRWVQGIGISGHTKSVTDIAWAKDGSYLLSTGLDQTTRMHAAWEHGSERTWHEMARPQIHGYDLNCIDSIAQMQFISGADEKLLRVFSAPRATAEILQSLCNIHITTTNILPEAANLPMLGLSNKAVEEEGYLKLDHDANEESQLGNEIANLMREVDQLANLQRPPHEDQLIRHTLWPETEKLYGHGHEISAVAASHDSTLVATSCRASALEYAVIRLYSTSDWREVKPPLKAHALTVTALCFSEDDQYLLSAGRDRQWTIFGKDSERSHQYKTTHTNARAHSRMILDACWAPSRVGRVFATAGRDKSIKLWTFEPANVECLITLVLTTPVTAIHVAPQLSEDHLMIASGTEAGEVLLYFLQPVGWTVKHSSNLTSQ